MEIMKKLFLFMFVFIFLVGPVSAFDFDNVKNFNPNKPIKGEITITNAFGLGDELAIYTLTDHTDYCTINCSSEGTAILNSPDKLFREMKFYEHKNGINGKEKNNPYKLYLWEENLEEITKNIEKSICDNRDTMENCRLEIVDTITETIDTGKWIEYNGQTLQEGNYSWRLEVTKQAEESIDFIGNAFGIDLKEWAVYGGVITTDGDYTIHTYAIAGNYTFNTTKDLEVEVLIVAGGGSGGSDGLGGVGVSGGGGAGGLIYNTSYLVQAGYVNVSVGNGGEQKAGTGVVGNNGGNSTFGIHTSLGGGGAGTYQNINGADGGSGGGGGQSSSSGGTGTAGQGNDGGSVGFNSAGGGGGGADSVGQDVPSANNGGNGGNGLNYTINGTNIYYSAGGGGGGYQPNGGTGGTGGTGNGGTGGDCTTGAIAPTGIGAGGSGDCDVAGTAGTDGIVIIRYLTVGAVTTTLISPEDNFNSSSSTIEFSANSTSDDTNLTNVTLYIWDSNGSNIFNNISTETAKASRVEVGDDLTGDWQNTTIKDGIVMHIGEVGGGQIPAFLVFFNFTNMSDKDNLWNISLFAEYRGAGADVVEIFLLNQSSNEWEDTGFRIEDSNSLEWHSFILESPTDYINPSGIVQMAINHTTAGSDPHFLEIDYLAIENVYSFSNVLGNIALSGNETIITNWTIPNLPDGNYSWNALTLGLNDTSDWGDNNRSFSVDATLPIINLTSPTGLIGFYEVGNNLTLNWSVTDQHLDNCWFNYNNTNTSVICGANNYSFITTNQQNLTFYANDTFGNLASSFTSWEVLFETYNVTFDNSTFEGSQETFTAEIILLGEATISEAIFYYNNTNYTTNIIFSGGEYEVTSTIAVPLIETPTNFSLGFFIVIGGQTYNPETFTQEVLNVNMSQCGPGGNLLLNITLYEEETKTNISGDIEINAQAISQTSLEVIESVELNLVNISSGEICLSPAEAFDSLYLDAEIRYSSNDYAPELYHIQRADMGNYPQNLSLFDLLLSLSTEFLIKYQDDNLITVEGAIVQLQRKYISEDAFEVVEAPLTSDIGTAIVHINLNSIKYQATIVKDGEVLDIFENLVFNCENELSGQCTENLFGSIDPQNDAPVNELRDFAYSITTDSTNNTITTLFSIPSGTPASVNIALTQKDQFGNESSCNQTIISSGGSIDCTYLDTIGDSFLILEISKDGTLEAQQGYLITEDSGFDWLDNNFMILLILLLTLVGMAFASPEIILMIGVFVMILGGAFWLINGMDFVIGLGSLAWLLIAIIILIYKQTRQEDR